MYVGERFHVTHSGPDTHTTLLFLSVQSVHDLLSAMEVTSHYHVLRCLLFSLILLVPFLVTDWDLLKLVSCVL